MENQVICDTDIHDFEQSTFLWNFGTEVISYNFYSHFKYKGNSTSLDKLPVAPITKKD